jgi:hypothetical protein
MTVSVSALDRNDPVILPEEISTMEKVVTTQEKITEELTADIDSALAEVVSGLQMLEMQQLSDKRMSLLTAHPVQIVHRIDQHQSYS